MKLEKTSLVKYGVFMLTLLIFLPGVQGIRQDGGSYSGVIERIDQDSKFIVINGAKILISPNTIILDEKGNILKTDALKPKLVATVEGVPTSGGLLAKKIVVTRLRKK